MARVGALAVYSPIEDVTLRVGGPRTGKSGEIADHIADAPGAVIATSTRLDLLETVGPLRSQQGPVGIFNPSGLGGFASTVHFDLVVGCHHSSTAYAPAEDMLGTVSRGDSEGEYWVGQARRVLSGLLHAAALGRSSSPWRSSPERRGRPASSGRAIRLCGPLPVASPPRSPTGTCPGSSATTARTA